MDHEPEDQQISEARRCFEEGYERQTRGELDEAIELYLKSLGLCPTAEAHTFLGWAYSMKGRYPEAIRECELAIGLDPDFGNPYNDIGAYLIDLGREDEALGWLEKAARAKRYDSYCYPHYNMGRIWEKKGDWQKALASYQDALRENADYTLARKAVNRLLGFMN